MKTLSGISRIGWVGEIESGRETQIGDRVRFTASDIFLPGPASVFEPTSGEAQLDGRVVEFSDSGSKVRAFAVVEVIRRQLVVVPLEKLEFVPGIESQE